MNIMEATRKALEVNGFIRRKETIPWDFIKIQPTNTTDCFRVFHKLDNRKTPRWNPQVDDLLADDWEIVA